MKNKSVPDTIFKRSKEIFSLAGRLAVQEVRKQINKSSELARQIDQAKEFAKSLKHLRGAALKVGQLLSIEGKDFLPPEVLEILASLSDGANTLAFAEIERIISQTWSPELRATVTNLNPQPFAAASIGQVHTAEYRGEKLALKIQYPGIAKSIDSDLNLLKKACQSIFFLKRKSISIDGLFEELKTVLKLEADYRHEAQAIAQYASAFRDEPDFVIPKTFPELCTENVLAMSFEEGLKVDAWLAQSPSLAEREFFARKFLDLYELEFFGHGLVQTDSNFGNFLFRPQERQLVLLDFGATKVYSPEFVRDYRKLLRAMRKLPMEAALAQCERMGLIDPRESVACKTAFYDMLRMSLEPFSPELQPFDFANPEYTRAVRDLSRAFIDQIKFSAPPHQIIFLHRKLGGVFGMIKKIGVSIDLRPYWDRLVGEENP